MFLGKNDSYYSYPFPGLILKFEDDSSMVHPTIMFKLLTPRDIERVRILENSKANQNEIHEEICRRCIIGILYFEDKVIDYNNSPAGLLKAIAEAIINKSKRIVLDLPSTFEVVKETVTIVDTMSAIVSRYTSTPIRDVREYPIDKLIKEFAIIQSSFPDIPTIVKTEEDTKG